VGHHPEGGAIDGVAEIDVGRRRIVGHTDEQLFLHAPWGVVLGAKRQGHAHLGPIVAEFDNRKPEVILALGLGGQKIWLPGEDSNLDDAAQSRAAYHWSTREQRERRRRAFRGRQRGALGHMRRRVPDRRESGLSDAPSQCAGGQRVAYADAGMGDVESETDTRWMPPIVTNSSVTRGAD